MSSPQKNVLPQLVDTKTAATIKGVTVSAVLNWVSRGLLTPAAIQTRRAGHTHHSAYLYDRKTVEAFTPPRRETQIHVKPKKQTGKTLDAALVTRLRRIEDLLDQFLERETAPAPTPTIADA